MIYIVQWINFEYICTNINVLNFLLMHEKLKEIRIAKGYSQGRFSKAIAMDQTTYSRKERGKSPITDIEWERFAKVLEVTKDEIKEDKPITINNENCTFNDSAVNTQFVNIPQNIFDIIIKYNQKLEEDNLALKTEINNLKNK